MRILGGDSSFVIGCAVDPTLSCVLFYLSFGLKTRLAMMSFLPHPFFFFLFWWKKAYMSIDANLVSNPKDR